MSRYRYRAIAPDGAVVSGFLEAGSRDAVIAGLRALGQYPVSAYPADKHRLSAFLEALSFSPKVSHRRLTVATQELATLVEAGIELDRALSILERLDDLGPLQKTVAAVRARIRDGASFADSLAAEPHMPKFFVSAVRAAEFTGSLETTLRRLSESLARSLAVREMITSALVYPVILLIAAGFSVLFILVFVLPEFQPLFAEAGKTLPWPTRALMAVGNVVRQFWWALILMTGLAVFAGRHALQDPKLRLNLEKALLRMPVLGNLLRAIEVQRFCRTMGTLLSNGVPLASAVPLASESVGSRLVSAAIAESAAGIREGEGLAERLARTSVFPSVNLDLIRVGEESGRLADMLLRQADLDEQRIRHSVDRLLALLVPGLTIVLGLTVGALIASLMSAILSVNDLALPK